MSTGHGQDVVPWQYGEAPMLVLSRKQDERIIIGDDIFITVITILGGRVRLCIQAPRKVRVSREEVDEAIIRQRGQEARAEPKTTITPPTAPSGTGHLVISRKVNEKIMIGDSITIMVISIRGDKVRLGIEAPRHISIHRREIYDAIQREIQADKKVPTSAA